MPRSGEAVFFVDINALIFYAFEWIRLIENLESDSNERNPI